MCFIGNFVFDAARDETRGKEAVEQLKKSGVNPKFFPLDITNQATIENLKKHLQDTYGGLDILVNNAGMAYKVFIDLSPCLSVRDLIRAHRIMK